MSYCSLIELAQNSSRPLPSSEHVLILHPQFPYHNLLIDTLLGELPDDVVYITLPQPLATLQMLWDDLAPELAAVYDVTLPLLDSVTSATAAEQFSQAVGSLSSLIIIITGYDGADESIHEFVIHTAQLLDGKARFMLSGRSWPEYVAGADAMKQGVAVVPAMPEHMLLNYVERDENRILLEARALGYGQVLVNGRQITQWDGVLPCALLFFFVDRGMITRDNVFSTFWPDLTMREATNVFHVTKRKISEILGIDLTVYSSGFYRISPQIDLHYDVVSFVEAVQNSAVAPPDEARVLLKRALAIYRREFLGDFEHPWAVRRRKELIATQVEALSRLARLQEEQGMIEEAMGLCGRAFGIFPQREDLAHTLMKHYLDANHPARALKVYDRLARELQSELGVKPGPEIKALADQVTRSLA